MNSPEVTPVLEWMLEKSATPFRLCEVSAIIDSSKVSQLRNAHSRWVEYEGDVRETADWAKCHAIIGVESSVVMGAIFSGSRGAGTHDINHLKPLVEKVQRTFQLEHVLGDKAYLSEEVVGWLFDRGIKAVIPVKKNWDKETKLLHYEACDALVRWYDDRQPDFHEAFRFRVKIEAFFSHLKRLASDYCWSRGRRNKIDNAEQPCVAWINELLCKFIYLNLRATVTREEMTGYRADYLVGDKFFPVPSERLIAA